MPLGNPMLIANFVVLFAKATGYRRQEQPQEPICGGLQHSPPAEPY